MSRFHHNSDRLPATVALWAPLLVVAALVSSSQAEHYDSPETSVEAGRESLDQLWGGYPWYDSANDDVRRITVTPPPAPSNWNLSWLDDVLRVFGWTLLAAMLVVLVWLVVRAYLDREVAVTRGTAPAAQTDSIADIDRVEALPFQVKRPQSDLLGEARRHYLDGNFSEAIIYLFSYQLVELDKGQLIRLTRGKTNRQYLREVRRGSSLGDLLEQTMVAFEDVFFGKHPLLRPRFETCWNQLDDFHRQLQKVMPT